MKRAFCLLLAFLGVFARPVSGQQIYRVDLRAKSTPYIERSFRILPEQADSYWEIQSFNPSTEELSIRAVDGSSLPIPVKKFATIQYMRSINDPGMTIQSCNKILVQDHALESMTRILSFAKLSIKNGFLLLPESLVPAKSKAALARRPVPEQQHTNLLFNSGGKPPAKPILMATVIEPKVIHFDTVAKKVKIDLETVEYTRGDVDVCQKFNPRGGGSRGPGGGKLVR